MNFKSSDWKHLIWILYAAALLLGLPFLFVHLLNIPIDFYYLVFLLSSIVFVIAYRKYSVFKIRPSLKIGWALGFILAVFTGLGFISLSLSDSLRFSEFISRLGEPIILWRGIAFGLASGVMISTLPFVIVWRSLAGHNPGNMRKTGIIFMAVVSIAILSFCHNLGLTGFSGKMNNQIQKNVIAGLPTLLSGNPMAAALAGTFLSVSEAVQHDEKPSSPPAENIIADNPKHSGGAN